MSSVDTLTSMHSIPESLRYNIIIAITSQNDARHNLDSDIYIQNTKLAHDYSKSKFYDLYSKFVQC